MRVSSRAGDGELGHALLDGELRAAGQQHGRCVRSWGAAAAPPTASHASTRRALGRRRRQRAQRTPPAQIYALSGDAPSPWLRDWLGSARRESNEQHAFTALLLLSHTRDGGQTREAETQVGPPAACCCCGVGAQGLACNLLALTLGGASVAGTLVVNSQGGSMSRTAASSSCSGAAVFPHGVSCS